jgi:SAM-dependent methyltransferase
MNGMPFEVIRACRGCGASNLESVFDLGSMPLSDGFAKSGTDADPCFPLEVLMCNGCGLAQLRHTVAPEVLFADDYPYFSSYTQTVVDNAKVNIDEALERFKPAKDALIVELASNDGYLLKHVAARGFKTLGIDPALGPVEAARKAGIETVHAFFSTAVAEKLAAEGWRADLIFGNNVLAHVAQTGDFVRGIATMLKPTGTAIIEAPYLRDLIDHNEFDTIYHEHLCYFSAAALRVLFQRQGLFLNDVKYIPIHGGSLRMFIQHRDALSDRLKALLAEEQKAGLDRPGAFQAFAGRVDGMGMKLRKLLQDLKGARIAGYGAAAKGTILLNHFRIGPEVLDWVADKNPHKQGLYVPGVKLPIVDPVRIDTDKPDYLLVLPWNHKDEIMRQQARFAERGGRFILPVPEPVIVGGG